MKNLIIWKKVPRTGIILIWDEIRGNLTGIYKHDTYLGKMPHIGWYSQETWRGKYEYNVKMWLTLLLLEHNIIIEGNFLSYTLIKMCFASEVESAMECGEHRGSQRWQLTIIHLSFGERKLYFLILRPCS